MKKFSVINNDNGMRFGFISLTLLKISFQKASLLSGARTIL